MLEIASCSWAFISWALCHKRFMMKSALNVRQKTVTATMDLKGCINSIRDSKHDVLYGKKDYDKRISTRL